jgi:hypothetical protein
LAPPTDATRAGIPPGGGAAVVTVDALEAGGAPLGGCGATVAVETPGAGGVPLVGCGPVDGVEDPAADAAAVSGGLVDAIGTLAGELACAGGFGKSSLDVRSVVVAPTPNNLRNVLPSAKYIPIAAPISTAMMSPPMVTSHPGLHGRKRETAGSSDRTRLGSSLSEGRGPTRGNSPGSELPCRLM